jgi:hypothetical protein
VADEGSTSDGSAEVTPEELERVRAERDQLEREVERLHDRPAKRQRLRRFTAVVLVVLTVLSLSVAVPGAWARRTLVNTDAYIALVGPLPSQPAVQEYLARTITQEVFTALGVEQRLQGVLEDRADRLAFLAGPIANAVEGFVQDRVQKLVASNAFQTLWVEANRFAQSQIVAILNGDSGQELSTVGGKVVLNLLPIVNQALAQVSTIATDLVGRPVTLPTVTAQEVPSEAISKIEAATGVQLPDTFGQIVVVDSSELAAAQDAFTLANRLVFLMVLLSLVFFVLALVAAVRRRRALIQIMAAWAIILVLERRGAIATADSIVSDARPENQAAARSVVDAVLSGLLNYTKWLLLIALVTLVISLITGPYPWAVTLRRWVKEVFTAIVGAAKDADTTAAATWIATHRDPMLLADAALVVLLLLVFDVSWLGFLVIALIGGVLAALVWRLSHRLAPQEPTPTPADPSP